MGEVVLREWETAAAGPDHPELAGVFLDDPAVAHALGTDLPGDALRVGENRHGLVVEARQHVGVVRLGPVRVRIRPKLQPDALWSVVTYGLGLDALRRHRPVWIDLPGDFVDLLGLLLVEEAERLWRLGVHHGYLDRQEWLGAPRGRPDLARLSRHQPLRRPELPCHYHAFTADIPPNRVVRSGLELARAMVDDLRLRGALHRTAVQWATACSSPPLTRHLLDEVDRARTRLDARYAPAHRLVRLLHARAGADDEHDVGPARLPGFLWNMATLFEAFVARFLGEHLPDRRVDTQDRLARLYTLRRGQGRAPDPRPDLVLREGTRPVAVLDTKYRDLSATALPREILYQMSVYSVAWGAAGDVPAIVLYAVPSGSRPDVEYELRIAGGANRRIVLRAVDLSRAAQSVTAGRPGPCAELARRWVEGASSRSA